MMNKGLEVIEAYWLFNLDPDHIEVIIHPQSIIHSLIELQDTSVLAQLGWADMRLPLLYALSYPERIYTYWQPLDLVKAGSFTFHKTFPSATVTNSLDWVITERRLPSVPTPAASDVFNGKRQASAPVSAFIKLSKPLALARAN
jgi:hypothetical protein